MALALRGADRRLCPGRRPRRGDPPSPHRFISQALVDDAGRRRGTGGAAAIRAAGEDSGADARRGLRQGQHCRAGRGVQPGGAGGGDPPLLRRARLAGADHLPRGGLLGLDRRGGEAPGVCPAPRRRRGRRGAVRGGPPDRPLGALGAGVAARAPDAGAGRRDLRQRAGAARLHHAVRTGDARHVRDLRPALLRPALGAREGRHRRQKSRRRPPRADPLRRRPRRGAPGGGPGARGRAAAAAGADRARVVRAHRRRAEPPRHPRAAGRPLVGGERPQSRLPRRLAGGAAGPLARAVGGGAQSPAAAARAGAARPAAPVGQAALRLRG